MEFEAQQTEEPLLEVLEVDCYVDALTIALQLAKHDAAVLGGDVVAGLSHVNRLKLALRPELEQILGEAEARAKIVEVRTLHLFKLLQ